VARPDLTIVVHAPAGADADRLARTLDAVRAAPGPPPVVLCARGLPESIVAARFPAVPRVGYDPGDPGCLRRILDLVRGAWLAWLPDGVDPSPVAPALDALRRGASIAPWLPVAPGPTGGARPHPAADCGWIARRETIDPAADWGPPAAWTTRAFGGTVLRAPVSWASVPVASGPAPEPATAEAPLSPRSSVLVAIPHHRCEPWLPACLRSVLEQTHTPSAVAVLHDGPDDPPRGIVARFPGVSLYRSAVRVGPYALVQSLLSRTGFDAVMFQDADDWSARARLATLLAEAYRTGAELVGGQEIRVDEICSRVRAVCYPRDVNAAFHRGSSALLLHPASVMSTRLVARLGGFATGLRFGADGEMLRRAAFAARIVNVTDAVYFRRIRPGSLTTDGETGLGSRRRTELVATVKRRAARNREIWAAGAAPDLRPLVTRAPVALEHLGGPAMY
jgi:hypothetical protein